MRSSQPLDFAGLHGAGEVSLVRKPRLVLTLRLHDLFANVLGRGLSRLLERKIRGSEKDRRKMG
jgi:hypothetical protein